MSRAAGDSARDLHSWKEITAYFGKNVRTVQNRQRDHAMPIVRDGGFHGVVANTSELDRWMARLNDPTPPTRRLFTWFAIAGVALLSFVAMNWVVSHSIGSADAAVVGKKLHLGAQSRFEHGRYEEAVDLATQAIRLRPDDAGPYHLRGMAYRRLGRYREAIDDLSRAISLKSTFAFSYYERGAAYRALAEGERTRETKIDAYERAREDETLAVGLAADDNKRDLFYEERGIANQQLGSLQQSRAYYERAAENFLEAILVNPKNGWAYHRLAAVYSALGDYRKALECYKSAIDLLPQSELHWVYQDRAAVKDRLPDAVGAQQDRLLAKALVGDKTQ